MLFYKNGEVSEEVWDILLYQHLSSTHIGDKRALMEAHRKGDYETKQMLHEKYSQDTYRLLLEHIDGHTLREGLQKSLVHRRRLVGVGCGTAFPPKRPKTELLNKRID